ncbi:MAG: response regulator transcription factor [Chitinispirillaceae bacterium]
MSQGSFNDLIVIADDVPLMAELVQYNIGLAGFSNNLVFNDPEECLSQIRQGLKPAVVISDYQMPHMTGAALLCRVKRILPGCAGIIMTSNPRSVRLKKQPFPVLKKGEDHFFCDLLNLVCGVLGVECRYCDWRALSI